MNKVSKLLSISSLSALLVSPLTTVSAEAWWQTEQKYDVTVSNIEPTPNTTGRAIIVFFKYPHFEEELIIQQEPFIGNPAPDWLKKFVEDNASPEVSEDICKVFDIKTLGETQEISVPWNCPYFTVIQRGKTGTPADPKGHFNGLFEGKYWKSYPQYGEGFNLGLPSPKFIYSQALKAGDATTVQTLQVVIEHVYEDYYKY